MRLTKYLISLCMAAATVITASAIPAYRKTFTAVQPDGTSITLTGAGDEYFHYFLTDEGQVVVRDGDAYVYAVRNADGLLVPSSVWAREGGAIVDMSRAERAEALSLTRAASPRLQLSEAAAQRAMSRAESAEAVASANPYAGMGRFSSCKYPTKGDVHAIVILVEYSDVKFSRSADEIHEYFDNLLSQPGFSAENATGSVCDWFADNSKGQFNPIFDLYGPVELPNVRSYYGSNAGGVQGNDAKPEEMVVDALKILALDPDFDIAKYDNDGDGTVDNVFLFYAGVGENYAYETTPEAVWPHSWNLSSATKYRPKGYKMGDVYVDSYGCACEFTYDCVTLDGIGTFVHEYSHVMGLPDEYNTVEDASYTPDRWSVLDSGPYNNNSRTPPAYSSFQRLALGWIEPQIVTEPVKMNLGHVLTSNFAYLVPVSDTEYFLFENRQLESWDSFLPTSGMLVWHIDYNKSAFDRNAPNNVETHQRIDIVEAGGSTGRTAQILRRYPFPGSRNVTSFTFGGRPSFEAWDGSDLGYPVTEITESDNGIITANLGELGSSMSTIVVEQSGIRVSGRALASDVPFAVTDLAGRRLAAGVTAYTLPAPGLYFIATPTSTTKLLCR